MSRWGVAVAVLLSLCATGWTQEQETDYSSMTARDVLRRAIENEQNIGDIKLTLKHSFSSKQNDPNPFVSTWEYIVMADGRFSFDGLHAGSKERSGSYDGTTAAIFESVSDMAGSKLGEYAAEYPVEAATDMEHPNNFEFQLGMTDFNSMMRPLTGIGMGVPDIDDTSFDKTEIVEWKDDYVEVRSHDDEYDITFRFLPERGFAMSMNETKDNTGYHSITTYTQHVQTPTDSWIATVMVDDSTLPTGKLFSDSTIANIEFDFPDDLINTTARVEESVLSDDLITTSGMLRHWWADADFSDPEMAYYSLLDFNELFGGFLTGMLALSCLILVVATIRAAWAVKGKITSRDES